MELDDHTNPVKNRQWPDSTTDSSNSPSTTSNFNVTINENNYSASKESLTADTHSITTSSAHNEPADIIQTAPLSSSHTQNMKIMNISVDYNA